MRVLFFVVQRTYPNYLQVVNLDYGKKKDNPIDLAVFSNKDNRNKPLDIRKTEVMYFKLK